MRVLIICHNRVVITRGYTEVAFDQLAKPKQIADKNRLVESIIFFQQSHLLGGQWLPLNRFTGGKAATTLKGLLLGLGDDALDWTAGNEACNGKRIMVMPRNVGMINRNLRIK